MHYFPKMTVIEIKNIKDESISITLTKCILKGFITSTKEIKKDVCMNDTRSETL